MEALGTCATAPPPPNAAELLRQAGLAPKKSWGQNFLTDQRILAEIAGQALAERPHALVELGAGLGALTHHLAAAHVPLIAVERDRDLVPLLRATLAWAPWVEIAEADAAQVDYGRLAERFAGPITVAGNLPYQLSSRILVALAERREIARAVLLVQEEVAERLAAPAGGRDYGLLSVLVQRRFAVTIARRVAPGAFLPPPRVTSAVVSLARLARPWETPGLVPTARAAFSQRRKTLRNALRGALRLDPQALGRLDAAFADAQVDPRARAETLDLAALSRLAERLVQAGLSVSQRDVADGR